MARVQLVIPDADKDRYVHQARREGMSLSAWLRAAAQDRLEKRKNSARRMSVDELQEFWKLCDSRKGPEREPDWEDHLKVINASRMSGFTDT